MKYFLLLYGVIVLVCPSCSVTSTVQNQALIPVSENAWPRGVFRIKGLNWNQRVVGLTIDDTPSVQTKNILKVLSDHNAKATFFIHGGNTQELNDGNATIKAILNAGHEVGSHMPDGKPTVLLSPEQFRAVFRENDRILRSLGARPRRFRPSHAFWNPGMSRFFDKEGREMGYRPNFYMGSYLPWDLVIDDPGGYAADLTSRLSPGLIIVFHDNDQTAHHNGQTRTVAALDSFLKRLYEKGYRADSLENVEKIAASNLSPEFRVPDAIR